MSKLKVNFWLNSFNPSGHTLRPERLKIRMSRRSMPPVNTRYRNDSYEFPND